MDTFNSETIPNMGFQKKAEHLLASRPVILQLMRFAVIGILNTGLNFILYNLISGLFHISAGVKLGEISIPSFVISTIQSYYWNKHWAFSSSREGSGLWRNFVRLVVVGLLGLIAFVSVLYGAHKSFSFSYYIGILVVFLAVEAVVWRRFGIKSESEDHPPRHALNFWIVSILGGLINAGAVSLITYHWMFVSNPDLNKNIALILATGLSMVWNFIGYKVLVFKK
jgi:putative flippase GtrA